MKSIIRYSLAVLPALLTLAFWQLGVWAFDFFGCKDSGKFIEPCDAYGYNIQGWLGMSMFWGQLAFYASLPICSWLLIKALARRGVRHVA